MSDRLGFSGRVARLFLGSSLTPLLGLTALLLGLFAVLVTPREEEPQINVTMANVIVPFPGASAQQVESLVATPMEKVLAEISGVKHIYSVSRPGRRGADRAVRGRRGAHVGDRPALERDLFEPGLAAARCRHRPAAGQAERHRRRAHPEPDAVDQGPAARRRTTCGRSRTRSSRKSSASRARATSTRSAGPTRRCTSRSTRRSSRATA